MISQLKHRLRDTCNSILIHTGAAGRSKHEHDLRETCRQLADRVSTLVDSLNALLNAHCNRYVGDRLIADTMRDAVDILHDGAERFRAEHITLHELADHAAAVALTCLLVRDLMDHYMDSERPSLN